MRLAEAVSTAVSCSAQVVSVDGVYSVVIEIGGWGSGGRMKLLFLFKRTEQPPTTDEDCELKAPKTVESGAEMLIILSNFKI